MPPILLAPGLMATAELFAPQIGALWPYGPVTVASTLEGQTMAEIAARILDQAPPQFALCGLSMGGHLSLEIWRQAPQRVLKLALLDTSGRADTAEQSARRAAMVARAVSGDFDNLIGEMMPAFFHPDHRGDLRLNDIFLRMARTVGVEAFARQTNAIIGRKDSLPDLNAISVPTLVLVGDADAVTPPALSEELAAGIPDATLVIVPNCGHISTLEQPDAVNKALVAWLER